MSAQTPQSVQTVCQQTGTGFVFIVMSTCSHLAELVLVIQAALEQKIFRGYLNDRTLSIWLQLDVNCFTHLPLLADCWICCTLMSDESTPVNIYMLHYQAAWPSLACTHSDTFTGVHTNTYTDSNKAPELLVKMGRWLTDWEDWALEAFRQPYSW